MGASQAELLAAHPTFQCSQDKNAPEESTCIIRPLCYQSSLAAKRECEREFGERNTYGGEPTSFILGSLFQNRLYSVSATINPRSYAPIRDAVSVKYGAPRETAETVTTKAGVSHENLTSTWSLADGSIQLRRLGSRVDEGAIIIMSREHMERSKDRRKAKASIAPSDL